eukprot:5130163-Pleurochrysis_carterae.AAC.1
MLQLSKRNETVTVENEWTLHFDETGSERGKAVQEKNGEGKGEKREGKRRTKTTAGKAERENTAMKEE